MDERKKKSSNGSDTGKEYKARAVDQEAVDRNGVQVSPTCQKFIGETGHSTEKTPDGNICSWMFLASTYVQGWHYAKEIRRKLPDELLAKFKHSEEAIEKLYD